MAKKALIVGAGLAGTCLAHQLISKGIDITLLDQGSNHSSAIAAGMVNPMVFRRMNKSWRLDEFLPEAQAFYQEIERLLNTKFYHPVVIRRFFLLQKSAIIGKRNPNKRSTRIIWNKLLQKTSIIKLLTTFLEAGGFAMLFGSMLLIG